jgi:protein-S-isoprenylcysteine O-methyltransferase Ste14
MARAARWALGIGLRFGVLAVPFIAAGRASWSRGWIFAGLALATFAVNLAVMRKKNPGLLRARLKPMRPERRFDKAYIALATITGVAVFTVAGLDARWGWSRLPFYWTYAGIALFVLGNAPVTWAMAVNPFLETTVRIQRERGHSVVDSGPYAIVRHPMYAGAIITYAGIPLILGSLWAFIPAGATMGLIVFRTVFEDRVLRRELPGYERYARRTRARLVPGLW